MENRRQNEPVKQSQAARRFTLLRCLSRFSTGDGISYYFLRETRLASGSFPRETSEFPLVKWWHRP